MPRPVAFTLIELLVVVTIIVVLLALLTPVLDKAIHQADLAVCAANQRAIAMGALGYAADAQRFYPQRNAIDVYAGKGQDVKITDADDRARMRQIMGVNGALNDPLAPRKLPYDSAASTYVSAPFGFWFGYRFTGEKGMRRVGDRWTYALSSDTQRTDARTYSLLVTDQLENFQGTAYAVHSDEEGLMTEEVFDSQSYMDVYGTSNPPGAAAGYALTEGATFTMARRIGSGLVPLYFDIHGASDDGSVQRVSRANTDLSDERLGLVGLWASKSQDSTGWTLVPAGSR